MCYFTSFWAGVLINLKTLLYPIAESVTEDKLLFLSSKDTKSIQMNSPNGKYSGEGSLQRLWCEGVSVWSLTVQIHKIMINRP